ncbi:unnamed protein product [Kluyveromyces dobzhanskii CBS 2104]|uniref:WGS project CCBQ000000000 data, contig 00041 n=1 Tax=Kluyveromyces dobzhanskii CBS 2104 TaxID=1427455 RepID=A0A0A8L0J6_9SACH|nr:unnamed protein product [Kluyveromyces dobzhanskii CBS 2104]
MENQLSDDLNRMTSIGFSHEYWDVFYKITPNYDLVPYLTKIDTKYPITKLDSRDKISTSLLTAMRHNIVFKAMEKYSDSDEHLDSYELHLLLPLSAMDSSFFSLINKRTIFYAKCHRLLNQRMKNLQKMKAISPTLVVKQAIEVLMQVMKDTFLSTSSEQGTIEQFFLPRVYSGESDPNELIIICILQEFSRQLDIKLSVTNGSLVIPDSLSPQGVTYLILKKKSYCAFEYQFFTETAFIDLLEDMNRAEGGTAIVDFATATTRLTARDIYTEFFIYLSQSEESAVIRNNEIIQNMHLSARAYPISKFGVDPDEVSLVGTFRKLLQLYATRDIQFHNFDVVKRKFVRSLAHWYPMDLNIKFESIDISKTRDKFLRTSLQEFIAEPHSLPLRKHEIIGKFVKRPEDANPSLVTNYDVRSERDCFELLAFDGKKYILFAELNSLTVIFYHVNDPKYHEFLTINKKQRLDYLFKQTVSEDQVVSLQPIPNVYM